MGSHHDGPMRKAFTLRDVILILIIVANNLHLTYVRQIWGWFQMELLWLFSEYISLRQPKYQWVM